MAKKNLVQELSEKIAERSAEKIAEQALQHEGIDPSPAEAERLQNGDTGGLSNSTYDIFQHCEDHFVKNGDHVIYLLKKNGAFLAQHDHPFSWAEIQKLYGGGYFTAVARSTNLGRIIKQQSQRVLDLPPGQQPAVQEIRFSDEPVQAPLPPPAPTPQGPSIAELLALMEAQSEKQARLARESREQTLGMISELAKGFAPLLASMFTRPVEAPRNDSTEMFRMMFDIMRETQKTSQDQTRLILDEMRAQQVKAPALDPLTLIEKLRRDDENMLDRAIKVQEILNEKATEIADSRSGNDEKEEDTTKILLKTLLPIVGGLGAQVVGAKLQAPAQAPSPQPQMPVQRQKQAAPRPQAPTPQPPALPDVKHPDIEVKPKPRPAAVVQINKKPVESPEPKPEPVQVETTDVKTDIMNIVMPYLKNTLIKMQFGSKTAPDEAARESLKLLAAKGITPELVKQHFTEADIMAKVREYNLPEALVPWFNGYYSEMTK